MYIYVCMYMYVHVERAKIQLFCLTIGSLIYESHLTCLLFVQYWSLCRKRKAQRLLLQASRNTGIVIIRIINICFRNRWFQNTVMSAVFLTVLPHVCHGEGLPAEQQFGSYVFHLFFWLYNMPSIPSNKIKYFWKYKTEISFMYIIELESGLDRKEH